MSATYPAEENEKSGIYPSLPTAPPMPPPYTPIDPAITVPTRAEIEEELRKVEDEIATLRAVLASKQERVAQLKRDLGVYGLDVAKDDIRRTAHSVVQSKAFITVKSAVTKQWNNVTQTNAYKTVNNNVSNFVKSVKNPSRIPDQSVNSSLNGNTSATPQPYSQPQAPPYYDPST